MSRDQRGDLLAQRQRAMAVNHSENDFTELLPVGACRDERLALAVSADPEILDRMATR